MIRKQLPSVTETLNTAARNSTTIHATLLDGGRTRDGTPRRLWRVTFAGCDGIAIRHLIEEYHGKAYLHQAVGEHTRKIIYGDTLAITPRQYQDLVQEAAMLCHKLDDEAMS
jgi:hypothetical protein